MSRARRPGRVGPCFRWWAALRTLGAIGAFAFSSRTANAAPASVSAASSDELTASDPSPDWAAIDREQRVLRLGMAGGMVFAKTYTTTALVATGALLICWHDREAKYCGLESAQSAWYELYIPAAGPFIALHHEEVRSNWKYTAVFTGSGVLQGVGAALALVSILWPKSEMSELFVPLTLVATRDSQTLMFRKSF